MYKLSICILEILILFLVIKILQEDRGMFNSNPNYIVSNPGIAAAIGNAANRHFENSQCAVGGCMSNKGGYANPSGAPHGFPQVTNRGFAVQAPEHLVNY